MGNIFTKNMINGIWERTPMNIFCGFPVTVATLPMFDAVATAMRKGIGLTLIDLLAESIIGVKRRQIVSLTKRAERIPLKNITRKSILDVFPETLIIQEAIISKNPDMLRYAIRTIMPRRNAIVFRSINPYASSSVMTLARTMRI